MTATHTGGSHGPTPSQTVGPFFRFGLEWLVPTELVDPDSPGAVVIGGQVLDGAGQPVPDAVVEIWQADPDGRYPPPDGTGEWRGWGSCLTDAEGGWQFTTVKPGRVDAGQAPHLGVTLFCRGILQRLVSRIYFPDETEANAADPVLVAAGPRATTLVAAEAGAGRLHHDLVLQGTRETVFFVF